ncbi:MAG TPA: Gfo/Idh/MocA family oxidoreductase [Prolixibacteraceae bacterium]|nr:Gfo/Idh/MocA family oxidoreductase [Prolixibacteraceae bacterium]
MDNKSTRRTFLRNSLSVVAGTLVLPHIIPSSAMGMNGVVPPSDRIVMGSIGVGSQGISNMRGFLPRKEVQYVALCDLDTGHLDKASAMVNKYYKNTDCRTYKDYRDFLEKEKIDAVCISVPDHWHSFTYIAAANKKINIYGEKPLARTIAEGQQIVKAVQKNKIVWQTGSWQRSLANFHKGAELVFNGRLGKVDRVEVGLPNAAKLVGMPPIKEVPAELDWDFWLGSAPKVPYRGVCHWNWRWILDYSGGQLTDWAGHHIDIAHWGLGLDRTGPIEVSGTGVYPGANELYNVPLEFDFNCKYKTGVVIRVANSSKLEKGMGVTWYGPNGWIHVDRGDVITASKPELLSEELGANKKALYKSNDHSGNFLECIRSGKETITPVEVAHRSISAGLLGEIAMTTKQTIKWDPDKEQIINNAAASKLLMRDLRAPWKLPNV